MRSTLVVLAALLALASSLAIQKAPEAKKVDSLKGKKLIYAIAYEAYKETGNMQILNSATCDACIDEITQLEQEGGDLTIGILDHYFKELCFFVPGGKKIKQECYDYLNEFAEDILGWIQQGLQPDEICQFIALCPKDQ